MVRNSRHELVPYQPTFARSLPAVALVPYQSSGFCTYGSLTLNDSSHLKPLALNGRKGPGSSGYGDEASRPERNDFRADVALLSLTDSTTLLSYCDSR